MAEPLKATFFAFRRLERHGVLRRAFFLHGFNALSLVTIGAGLPFLFALPSDGMGASLPAATELLLVGSVVLIVLLYQLNAASFEAACLRWLIRNEQRGAFGVSLDGDTWRIFFAGWLWLAVYLVLWLIVFAIAVVVAIPFRDRPDASRWVPIIFFSIFGVAVLFVTVWFGAGNAVGSARRKFSFFEGLKVSKGRFWALLGSWLIASLVWAITGFVMLIAVGVTLAALTQGNFPVSSALGGAASLLGGVIATRLLLTPFIAGINARAVLAAAEEGRIEGFHPSASVARVFE